MNFTILQARPEDFDWIVSRTGCGQTSQFRALKAVDSTGKIRAMVAYDLWTENAVQAHMAAECPIAWRRLLADAFRYPFVHADVGIIFATIPADNHRSLKLARRFGFAQKYRVPDGWAVGVDLVFLEMRKENCRWLTDSRKAAA